jgi:pyruvate/2-oxoglutarate dehydrogenase complex dihydrolipoamide acyltransferase (E2) component
VTPAAIALLRERGIRYTRQEWADALGVSLQALLDVQLEHDLSVMAAVPGDHVRQPKRHARRVADLRVALGEPASPASEPDEAPAAETDPAPARPAKVRLERRRAGPPDALDDPEGFLEWRLRLIKATAERIRAEEQGEDLEEVRFG